MEIVDEIIKFLRGEKEEWDREEDVKVSFKDVQTKVLHKASSWITFQDGSGGIKIYEEGSIPYSHDLDLAGVGRDVILGGAALFVPVVGPWVVASIVGMRSGKIIGTAAFTEFAWRNTYIFVFNALKECVFAMELHYKKGYFIAEALQSIEDAVKNIERERVSNQENGEWEYEDEDYEDKE